MHKSIQSTVRPPEEEQLSLIEWLQYIGHLKGNTVRPGGIAYCELEPLEQVKKQLKIN